MQLSEYELRYILGLVLVACIIRYFIYSWSLHVIKKEADAFDTEHCAPLGDADCTRQENDENNLAETKRMYLQWALIAVLFAVAVTLLFIGS